MTLMDGINLWLGKAIVIVIAVALICAIVYGITLLEKRR